VESVVMKERVCSDVSDGFSWWCRQCKGWKTIREGSFSKILAEAVVFIDIVAGPKIHQ